MQRTLSTSLYSLIISGLRTPRVSLYCCVITMLKLSYSWLVGGKVFLCLAEACVILAVSAGIEGSLGEAWKHSTDPYHFGHSLLDPFFIALCRLLVTGILAVCDGSRKKTRVWKASGTSKMNVFLVCDGITWIYLVVKFIFLLMDGAIPYRLILVGASAVAFSIGHVWLSHLLAPLSYSCSQELQSNLIIGEDAERGEITDTTGSSDKSTPRNLPNNGAPPPMTCCKKACRVICSSITCLLLLALSPVTCFCTSMICLKKCCCKNSKEEEAEKKEQARLKQLDSVQAPHPEYPMTEPGNGAPLLTGIRVVELATVIAGPSAGRILADNGAEVIRVEPPSGTMWRRYLKFLERDRKTFVTSFEHVNFNKSSVVIDISTSKGLADIKNLLSSADVFITNVRLPALKRAGLDYASIKNSHPHLVYGHLSAWGLVGPDEAAPGYDFGAFWAQTGMASQMNAQGHFSQYPGAFGDTVGGSALVGGLATGLRERLQNGGYGCFVEGSLLRTGMWVMAPLILRNAEVESRKKKSSRNENPSSLEANSKLVEVRVLNDTDTIPEYRSVDDRRHCTGSELADANDLAAELYDQFLSHDRVRFAILALGPTREAMQKKHKQLMKTVHDKQMRYHSDNYKLALCATFREYAAANTFQSCSEILESCNLPFRRSCDLMSNKSTAGTPSLARSKLYTEESRALVLTDLTPDLKAWVRPPFDFSCCDEQEDTIKRRAPELGAQTRAILSGEGCGSAFKARPKGHKAALPRPELGVSPTLGSISDTPSPSHMNSPLKNVLVVELSGLGQSISAACTQLSDQGASVYKIIRCVDGLECDALDTIDPFFGKQLNRGKTLLYLRNGDTNAEIYRLLCSADVNAQIVFATNLPAQELDKMGLDEASLRKKLGESSRGKQLIYVSMTSCGKKSSPHSEHKSGEGDSSNSPSDAIRSYPEGSLGAFFQGGLLSDVLGNGSSLPVACPFQFGEMLSSVHCKTAIDLALFHHARTGEGQKVDLNLLRCGLYANLMFTSMSQKNPKMGLELRKMSFDSYQTRDGKWVQLLGVDYKTHVPRVFKALGISGKSYKSVLGTFFCRAPFFQSPMEAVPLIFGSVTDCISEGIGALSWAELQRKFNEHDVWYTTVATPAEVLRNEQAHATRAFCWPTEDLAAQRDMATARINTPIQLYSWKSGGSDSHVYGEPDSTRIVVPTGPKAEQFI